jgi:hypothetical protein
LTIILFQQNILALINSLGLGSNDDRQIFEKSFWKNDPIIELGRDCKAILHGYDEVFKQYD